MKPVDRSKLILTTIAGGLLIVAAALFYAWRPTTENVPLPVVKTMPRPAPPPKPVITIPPPKSIPPTNPIPRITAQKIAQRLTAGIYHQKELISLAQKETQAVHENMVHKNTVLDELSQEQKIERDRSRRTLLLMKSLEPTTSLPAAQQAVAAAVEQMDQASGLLQSSAVRGAVDHEQLAIHQMETALALISQH